VEGDEILRGGKKKKKKKNGYIVRLLKPRIRAAAGLFACSGSVSAQLKGESKVKKKGIWFLYWGESSEEKKPGVNLAILTAEVRRGHPATTGPARRTVIAMKGGEILTEETSTEKRC